MMSRVTILMLPNIEQHFVAILDNATGRRQLEHDFGERHDYPLAASPASPLFVAASSAHLLFERGIPVHLLTASAIMISNGQRAAYCDCMGASYDDNTSFAEDQKGVPICYDWLRDGHARLSA